MKFLANSLDLARMIAPVIEVCNVVIPILLTVVGSVGGIYCIVLGVKYARADEPQEHEKAKNGLKNAIIGFVLIFILLIMLKVGCNIFTDYWENYETSFGVIF